MLLLAQIMILVGASFLYAHLYKLICVLAAVYILVHDEGHKNVTIRQPNFWVFYPVAILIGGILLFIEYS